MSSKTKYSFNTDTSTNEEYKRHRFLSKREPYRPPTVPYNRKPPQSKGFCNDMKIFIWNPNTNEFMRRTWLSWVKILGFYLLFYTFLAAFFAINMTVFYQTLDTHGRPKYTAQDSLLTNPGLTFRPSANFWSLWYNPSRPDSSLHYVSSIRELLQPYMNSTAANMNSRIVYKNCAEESPAKDEVCSFNVEDLGSSCTESNNWGYTTKSPCFFLKINKIIDWVPQAPKKLQDLPNGLQKYINNTDNPEETLTKHVFVWCESDKGELEQPAPGIPLYYYPFINQEGYLRPLVPIRLLDLENDKVLVVCRIWGHNIVHIINKRVLGLAAFQVQISGNY
ncbi:sodium/potassium-transporting ATPase subunit beta [Cherax quadricarinatus]|uniref:sodium/potassium-transporting ATPase subunit beta n=1 Tax=Cherax quadricarinatus TaxID=27406 RepID=UPI002379A8E0|nr:sodium/potassium-transporting ATPase subunit beta-like [Cherax quadricarinatus]